MSGFIFKNKFACPICKDVKIQKSTPFCKVCKVVMIKVKKESLNGTIRQSKTRLLS